MEKKYTQRTLGAAVRRYFASISREVPVTEKRDTGQKDSWGHAVYEQVQVYNKLGEPAVVTEYLIPPTLGGLCTYLKIWPGTWSRWCDGEKYPEFAQVVADVKNRMLTWRQEQVVTRDRVTGLIWDMEVNHGVGRAAGTGEQELHGVLLIPEMGQMPPHPEEEHG